MGWASPSEALLRRFDRGLPDDPRVERRQMFGCPCAFVGGQMFAGVFRDQLFVRLGSEARDALLAEPGARPFEPTPGRVMREYVCVPRPLQDRRVSAWIAAARDYATSLPPKPPRRRARAAAARRAGRR